MTTIWSNRNSNRSAPCTIFSTTTLSPRQIANKAYTLGCKKLDRDDKRSKQKYHVRERLLLCNTIAKAEEVLNARTRRTNRRVMAAEDEEEASSDEFSLKHQPNQPKEHHSPLRSSASQEEEEDEEEEDIIHKQQQHTQQRQQQSTTTNHASFSNTLTTSIHSHISPTSPQPLLPRDCRIVISNNTSNTTTSPIATTII